jgi:hypothetical protein
VGLGFVGFEGDFGGGLFLKGLDGLFSGLWSCLGELCGCGFYRLLVGMLLYCFFTFYRSLCCFQIHILVLFYESKTNRIFY